jgi:hypothetical protein
MTGVALSSVFPLRRRKNVVVSAPISANAPRPMSRSGGPPDFCGALDRPYAGGGATKGAGEGAPYAGGGPPMAPGPPYMGGGAPGAVPEGAA